MITNGAFSEWVAELSVSSGGICSLHSECAGSSVACLVLVPLVRAFRLFSHLLFGVDSYFSVGAFLMVVDIKRKGFDFQK